MGNEVHQSQVARDYSYSSFETSSRFDDDDVDEDGGHARKTNNRRKGILPKLMDKILIRQIDRNSSSTREQDDKLQVSEMSLLLARAWNVGRGKAVEVLDTLGSSMTNMNISSGFIKGTTTRGNKISILAFEVANTIVNGATLMQSLSRRNIEHLKEVVLHSEGVHCLVSTDMEELLRIAASDKRKELKAFAGEVVRFGNYCIDFQWHNLDRDFEKYEQPLYDAQIPVLVRVLRIPDTGTRYRFLKNSRHGYGLGTVVGTQGQLQKEAEILMQLLMTMVQYTAELYDELLALDKLRQDYIHKLQNEDNSTTARGGDNLAILKAKLKFQKKHVRSLKRKSLWSKVFEEVVENLVIIIQFLHVEIHDAFRESAMDKPAQGSQNNDPRLGPSGLALHYADIITQIDTLVSQSSSISPTTRDNLYQGLPPSVKSALCSELQAFHVNEGLTVPDIKAEMEKTLKWLVPFATKTTEAHRRFGWVGEWINKASEVIKELNNGTGVHTKLLKIETLYHANKGKTEECILHLIIWLHHLITRSRTGINGEISYSIYKKTTSGSSISSPRLTDKELLWNRLDGL